MNPCRLVVETRAIAIKLLVMNPAIMTTEFELARTPRRTSIINIIKVFDEFKFLNYSLY
jgi:hypothetical protein